MDAAQKTTHQRSHLATAFARKRYPVCLKLPVLLIVSACFALQAFDFHKREIVIVGPESVTSETISNIALDSSLSIQDSLFIDATSSLTQYALLRQGAAAERCVIVAKCDLTDTSLAAASRLAASLGKDMIVDIRKVHYVTRVIQPGGWRGHDSPSYRRPVKYETTVYYLAVLYDIVHQKKRTVSAKMNADRPLLYSFFKRFVDEEDIVASADNLYAAPLIRALKKAIDSAFK